MGRIDETGSTVSGSSGARPREDTAGEVELAMRDADAILWALDRDPLLRSTIVAVGVLDRDPPFERVAEKLEALCARRHHFRSVVTPSSRPWGRPRWQEVPGFEASSHLAHVRAPLPGDMRGVLDLAQSMGGRPFDPARPLWEAVLVDGMAGGGAAIIIKVHHSVVDGVGGLKVVADILDADREGVLSRRAAVARTKAERSPGPGPGARGGIGSPGRRSLVCPQSVLGGALRAAERVPRSLLGSARETVRDPTGSVGRWLDTVVDSAALVAPSPTPLSPLMQDRSLDRHFETVDLPEADFHRAARLAGVTLNDLFVAGLLRGLSRYHDLHGRPSARLRALMPVSTRRPDDPLETNRFVPARFVLPADLASADAYLDRVPPLLGRWKHSTALPVSDLLTAALDRLPPPVVARVFASMLKGVDFTATDVPGAPVDVYLAGAKVESLLAFPPTAGAALNAGLVTMAGRPSIGITIDPAAVPDPVSMRECLRQGLDEMIGAAERRGSRGTGRGEPETGHDGNRPAAEAG
jgi:diacylglycerol O-acyltransferase / wax synthase